MDAKSLHKSIEAISKEIDKNRDYLVKLDQKFGDGDLGISMSEGFRAVSAFLSTTPEKDLGKLLQYSAKIFNAAAPSSLETILSFGFTGMAQTLKGTEESSPQLTASALEAGLEKIIEKTGTKPGEKTILDSLYPAIKAYQAQIANPQSPPISRPSRSPGRRVNKSNAAGTWKGSLLRRKSHRPSRWRGRSRKNNIRSPFIKKIFMKKASHCQTSPLKSPVQAFQIRAIQYSRQKKENGWAFWRGLLFESGLRLGVELGPVSNCVNPLAVSELRVSKTAGFC